VIGVVVEVVRVGESVDVEVVVGAKVVVGFEGVIDVGVEEVREVVGCGGPSVSELQLQALIPIADNMTIEVNTNRICFLENVMTRTSNLYLSVLTSFSFIPVCIDFEYTLPLRLVIAVHYTKEYLS